MNSVQLSSALAAINLQTALPASAAAVGALVINEAIRRLYRRIVAYRLESTTVPILIPHSVTISALILSSYLAAKIMEVAGFILAIPNFVTGSAAVAAAVVVCSALFSRNRSKTSWLKNLGEAQRESLNIYTLDRIKKELINNRSIKLSAGKSIRIIDVSRENFATQGISQVLEFLVIPKGMTIKNEDDCITLRATADCDLTGRYTFVELEALQEKVRKAGYAGYTFTLKPERELRIHIPPTVDLTGHTSPSAAARIFQFNVRCLRNPPYEVSMILNTDSRELILRNTEWKDMVLQGVQFK